MRLRRYHVVLWTLICTLCWGGPLLAQQAPPGTFGPQPVAWFTFSPELPRTGDLIHFDASQSTGEGGIVSYQWDTSGDGYHDTAGREIWRRYNAAGRYPVTLTVHDTLGRRSQVTRWVVVGSGAIVTADVLLTISSEPTHLPVYIDGKLRGNTPTEVRVEPGVHHIRIHYGGTGDWETEIDLTKLGSLALAVTLRD